MIKYINESKTSVKISPVDVDLNLMVGNATEDKHGTMISPNVSVKNQ